MTPEVVTRSQPAGTIAIRSAPDAASAADAPPTMFGTLALFNQWTPVDSPVEGQFMERLAPGSFTKTIAENLRRIQVIYDHGQDAQLGRKPLGKITALRSHDRGVDFEVQLFADTAYVRELLPALRGGSFGSSFRFKPIKVDTTRNPSRSAYNPDGWPEKTIRELRLVEFGPTAFPVYDGTSAGVRSVAAYAPISLDAFIARLGEPPSMPKGLSDDHLRTTGDTAAIRRWLDRVAPLPPEVR
jgi:HK97 family phage prohead protease